jgi:flagellar basal body-associated protein FliL
MSQSPPTENSPPKAEEIPLEDIDKILASEDPEFTKSLEEVRAVETDKSVVIEASAIDETAGDELGTKAESAPRGLRALTTRFRLWLFQQRMRAKAAFIQFLKNALIWLKVKPKEYALFSFAMLKVGIKKASIPLNAFKNADRSARLMILILIAIGAGCAWILIHNMKGIWIPPINEPILRQFAPYADSVETFDPKEPGESFYSAFPQERFEYLFQRMKVNLRRTPDSPWPMGAFELIVALDSKDTAIEVRDREVEFSDLLQRVFEEESFNDLESELGKNKLKARIKRELNQQLTQGWVKEVSFKTFVIKP